MKALKYSKQSAPRQMIKAFSDILDVFFTISDESSVDLSDSICQMTVNEVQKALQETVFTSVCTKTSLSQNWRTARPFVTAKVAKMLSNTIQATHPLETAVTGKNIPVMKQAQEKSNQDTATFTGTIIVALDSMDVRRNAKPDLKQTGDLLMTASESKKDVASTNSQQYFWSTTLFFGENNGKAKTFRAVSEVLKDSGLFSDNHRWFCTIHGFFNVENHPAMKDSMTNAKSSSKSEASVSVLRSPTSAEDIQTFTSDDFKPVDVKRRFRFPFLTRMKASTIYLHWKKSNKRNPAGLVPDDQKPCSSSAHLQESSHLESTSSKNKCCKLLSRMCSAISKALPLPFKCMRRAC
ncbi:uncharacterized protein LOC143481234 [Brachyhypopomus gauderio]|uniref:uncharacterized protein LOC143481234 n=1 Tax=Brachyhypopomus gauderio TaxID=698409 RepID=UPI0040426536